MENNNKLKGVRFSSSYMTTTIYGTSDPDCPDYPHNLKELHSKMFAQAMPKLSNTKYSNIGKVIITGTGGEI